MKQGMELELVNILNAASQLFYQNESFLEVLNKHIAPDLAHEEQNLEEELEKFDLFTLYTIITSNARVAPHKTKFFSNLVPYLHYQLSTQVKSGQA